MVLIGALALLISALNTGGGAFVYDPPLYESPGEQHAAAAQLAEAAQAFPPGDARRELMLKAIFTLEPVESRWPREKDWVRTSLRTQAQYFEQIGDLTNARKKYEAVLEVSDDPRHKAGTGISLARIYWTMKDIPALEKLLAGAGHDPRHSPEERAQFEHFGLLLRQLGRPSSSQRVAALDRASAAALTPLMRAKYAIDAVELLIYRTPQDPSIVGRLNAAERLVDATLSQHPGHGDARALKDQVRELRAFAERRRDSGRRN